MRRYTVQQFLLTYGSWISLRQRCVYKATTRADHARYKGRGIRVCARWSSFAHFIEDVGPRPGHEYSLDRYPNNDGNYEPGNVRWATAKQQASNRSTSSLLTHNGLTLTRAEWSRRTGLSQWTIGLRVRQGWSVKDALTVPACARNPAYVTFAGGRARGKKLELVQVEEIVAKARTGKYTATALGREFGVSGAAVCHITKQFSVSFKKGRPKICQTSVT